VEGDGSVGLAVKLDSDHNDAFSDGLLVKAIRSEDQAVSQLRRGVMARLPG
jgi:hypothetical protein